MIKINHDIMGQKGYLLKVDIEYPRQLWNKHKDIPFDAELRVINKTRKLVTTCQDKESYVLHISALQQALSHGVRLKEVHKVIKFDQSLWVSEYINLCVDKRKNASSVNLKKLL